LMTYTRGKRCRSVVGSQFFGVVSSKKAKFFGLRLHLTTTDSQLIDEWLLAPAAHHDGKVLEELVFNSSDLYLTAYVKSNFEKSGIISKIRVRKPTLGDYSHAQYINT